MRMVRECTALLLIVASAAAALARTPAAAADDRNAATWYRRAMDRLGAISEADWETMYAYWDDPVGPPPPGLRDVMARATPIFDLVHRGSRQEYADYDLDYSQGFELVLPHLAQLRSVAKMMRYDVMMRLHDGDTAGAAGRVATMYRMSGHLTTDGTLISSLVGAALFGLGEQTSQMGFDRMLFSSADSEIMLRGLSGLDAWDPFGMVEGVASEQAIAVDWLTAEYGTQEQRAHLSESIGWLANSEELLGPLVELSDDEFAGEIDRYDLMMDRVVTAFEMEDEEAARAALEVIGEEVEAGEHGLVASFLTPAFVKVYDRLVQAREHLREQREMLEGLAKGEIAPVERANAALFYGRAIELIEEMGPERFAAVCAVTDVSAETDPALLEALRSTGAIIDLLREGSGKSRCDFAILRPGFRLSPCPAYVAGLHEAFRLLHSDAVRSLKAGDGAAATDRLETSLGVVAHLSQDEPITSALVAHAAFGRGLEIAEGALETESLDGEARARLRKAVMRIGRKDPFGYIGSVTGARATIGGNLYVRLVNGGSDPDLHDSIYAVVNTWDGDQILCYLVIHETLRRAGERADDDKADGERADDDKADGDKADGDKADGDKAHGAAGGMSDESPERRPADPIERLDGIVSLEVLEAARNEAQPVAPALARGEMDIFGSAPFPRFADVADRMRRARSDLRDGVNALREPAEEQEPAELREPTGEREPSAPPG